MSNLHLKSSSSFYSLYWSAWYVITNVDESGRFLISPKSDVEQSLDYFEIPFLRGLSHSCTLGRDMPILFFICSCNVCIHLSWALTLFSSLAIICCSSWIVGYLFIFGLFFIFWAVSPNLSVETVSDMLLSCGEHVSMRVVFELPPSESWIILVSLESR